MKYNFLNIVRNISYPIYVHTLLLTPLHPMPPKFFNMKIFDNFYTTPFYSCLYNNTVSKVRFENIDVILKFILNLKRSRL